METVGRADQLGRDAQTLTRATDTALEDMSHVEDLTDLAKIDVLAAERESRCTGSDPEARELCQCVEELFGDSLAEVLVRLVLRQVDKGQHGDRLLGIRSNRFRRLTIGDESLRDQYNDGNGQDHDDQAVQLAPGLPGDRLAAIDVLLALDALRRHLEGPGKQQGDG